MAPEQAMAQELGPWTDLYSIGVMAYELFASAGRRSPSPGQPMALLMQARDRAAAAARGRAI